MRRRYRHIAALGATTAVIVLPPYGDEGLGLALGAAIEAGHVGRRAHMDEVTTSNYRERARGRSDRGGDVPKWVGAIVIGAVIVLAFAAGGLRQFVQH